jgi:low affinity Fe/Cu permease
VAARHQHGHHHRDVPDGLPHPALAEQGRRGLHLKLNEIVAALQGASNHLINVEDLSEDEVRLLRRHYRRLGELARESGSLTDSHSIEQAVTRHASKNRPQRRNHSSAQAR